MPGQLPVPGRVSVRLDDVTRAALADYMVQHQLTLSQATRVLLALALKDESEDPDVVFRSAAFREGLVLGVAQIRKVIATSLDEALSHLDDIR